MWYSVNPPPTEYCCMSAVFKAHKFFPDLPACKRLPWKGKGTKTNISDPISFKNEDVFLSLSSSLVLFVSHCLFIVCLCVNVYFCVYLSVLVCTSVCNYMCLCVSVYMSVCVCQCVSLTVWYHVYSIASNWRASSVTSSPPKSESCQIQNLFFILGWFHILNVFGTGSC